MGDMRRRELIEAVRGLLAGLLAAAGLPTLAFLWKGSRLRDPDDKPWADLGAASKVEGEAWQQRALALERSNRWRRETQEQLVYLRRKGEQVEAVSAVCPHTGCLVRRQEEGFACPCHRSRFDAEGRSVEGPSPRPLDRLECKVERGRLFVKYERFRPGVSAREPLGG